MLGNIKKQRVGKRVPKEITYSVNENGCWEVTSHKPVGRSYPRIRVKKPGTVGHGKLTEIHRIFYERYKGPILEGEKVRHQCDNPICCNPDHLEVGTQQDNMDDKVERNRQVKGRGIHTVKLSDEQVLEIFKNTETSRRELATKFNVTYQTIATIQRGESWTHLTNVNPNKTIIEGEIPYLAGSKYEELKSKLKIVEEN
jgi:hypothetical protein